MGRLTCPNTRDYTKITEKIPVLPHQAVTPAQMLEMANQGIPISADSAAAFSGEKNPSWDLSLDKTKHVDPAELWQEQQTIKRRYRDLHKQHKKLRELEKLATDE